ncbi:Magnesium transporter ALR1 [Wickerhamomyces ciferrii]|uniref:Magnesium transporter ALR1 n=1 Tax=Wickerhamomyces ciferrii (strain ATCC 14091 / BCRC 22168 / CBS 111 / JCM 3599 / NBRC 0793 / NRRL Y-1031 F-60-10) TaxID=1206466 RepID=K0KIG5_WICCF|nr:Magnesium transporter ALR1 [Wickerhamomyces ciferrii]CCH41972.1 Magnesium transporter ALR1 [Wickerhamomyces ciferrii]
MSDAESTHSLSPHHSHSSMKTEGLYDHRHQPSSLPVRRGSSVNEGQKLPPPALNLREIQRAKLSVGDDDEYDADEYAIQDSPVIQPSNYRSDAQIRPSRLSHSLSSDQQGPTDMNPPTHVTAHQPQQSTHRTQPAVVRGNGGSLAAAARRGRSRSRSRSFTEQLRTLVNPKDEQQGNQTTQGILLNKSNSTKKRPSKNSGEPSPVLLPLNKTLSRSSAKFNTDQNAIDNEMVDFDRRRRLTRASLIDSDNDSHASRESQETEEDVCFPMLPEHVKINGIDFDEVEEFIKESRAEAEAFRKERELLQSSSESTYEPKSNQQFTSSAAAKYTPQKEHSTSNGTYSSDDENPGVSFGNNKVEGETTPPDRFSFFCSESDETIHAPDIQSLVKPGESVKSLFRSGQPTWWLDCSCPTDAEMKVLAKAFGIHPLTAEDIRMQETREKVELFRSYYFVCFHTFESDNESEEFLEPINVYIVVFREGVLTFHFNPISHAANVRRRVRQLRDYVDVSADWLCYALIDDITDSFAPVIHAIEYEADAIEDQVFLTREMDFSHMLQKIGESRRKVMTLMRLLSGKADVIKMFAKRCQDEAQGIGPALTSNINLANLSSQASGSFHNQQHQSHQHAQPRADIALYLGDIQDHVVTMFQNLLSYEKIFSRSHSNYLAQLQVESFNSNNKVTEMLSKVTLIGTILVPLNLITGLFGMNVKVPGQDGSNLGWFFGILGVIFLLIIFFSVAANWWLTRKAREQEEAANPGAGRRSILGFGKPRRTTAPIQRETRSILSFPSRINRYD